MRTEAFSHRPSRVLALFRIVLAALLGMWVWVDPSQPFDEAESGNIAYLAYLACAVGFALVAWRSWWHSFRLSIPSFMVDSAAFVVALYYTHAISLDFFSPFITFFVFLVVTASLRWDQRSMPAIALLLCTMFLLAGVGFRIGGAEVDLAKLLRRFSYLALLSVLLIWFAWNRAPFQVPRFHRKPTDDGEAGYAALLDYAMAITGASGAALAWVNADEPWGTVHQAGSLGNQRLRLSPEAWQSPVDEAATLFDLAADRQITLADDGALSASRAGNAEALLCGVPVTSGIAARMVGATGSGQLILTGITDLAWDDLAAAKGIAREMAMALDEMEREALAQEVTVTRTRTDIARDLHDSVAQSLAGVRYRLEGLRALIAKGQDPGPELEEISSSIRGEQEQVRGILSKLRRGEQSSEGSDLTQDLAVLLTSIERQWQIVARLEHTGASILVPMGLAYDIQQIVREAAANAVRHGQAKRLTLGLRQSSPTLVALAIGDDGKGMQGSAQGLQPRSIAERIAALGGTLAIRSSARGTLLEIALPVRPRT